MYKIDYETGERELHKFPILQEFVDKVGVCTLEQFQKHISESDWFVNVNMLKVIECDLYSLIDNALRFSYYTYGTTLHHKWRVLMMQCCGDYKYYKDLREELRLSCEIYTPKEKLKRWKEELCRQET